MVSHNLLLPKLDVVKCGRLQICCRHVGITQGDPAAHCHLTSMGFRLFLKKILRTVRKKQEPARKVSLSLSLLKNFRSSSPRHPPVGLHGTRRQGVSVHPTLQETTLRYRYPAGNIGWAPSCPHQAPQTRPVPPGLNRESSSWDSGCSSYGPMEGSHVSWIYFV